MAETESQANELFPNAELIGGDRYLAPRLAPETYPGEVPADISSLMVGDRLQAMEFDPQTGSFQIHTAEGVKPLDEVLSHLGVPGMVDRFPITVFGSNRCPGQLLDKFKPQDGDHEDRSSLEVMPMVVGTLKGFDVVYNAKVGNMGYFFADLYQGPETADTEIEVSVMFATQEQLDRIHESEKAYDYTLLGDVDLGVRPGDEATTVNPSLPVFAHTGKAQVYAQGEITDRHPVALEAINAIGRKLSVASQVDFQEMFFTDDPDGLKHQAFIEMSGDAEIKPGSDTYVENMRMARAGGKRTLDERKAFQAALVAATTDRERMDIDPAQFEVRTKIDVGEDVLPTMGHIAVLKALKTR